jgi:hypothetical protein
VPAEHRLKSGAPAPQIPPGGSVADLAHLTPRIEAEDAAEEEPIFIPARFEQ